MARAGSGVPATRDIDRVDRGYVDKTMGLAAGIPYVGWYTRAAPSFGAATSVLTSGRLNLTPIDLVAPRVSYDQLRAQSTIAQSGGTASLFLGVYGSDIYDLPDTTNLIRSGTATALTSVGYKDFTFGTPWTPEPGRYWLASLYYASSAPTTAPSLYCVNNSWFPIGVGSAVNLNSAPRALTRSGLTALPTDATTSANVTLVTGTDVPTLLLRRSA